MTEDILAPDDDDSRRDGEQLERRTVKTFERWGYTAKRREPLIKTEADVVACREESRDEPADFVIAECKNWARRSIDPPIIYKLVMQAFIGRAMPVLVHTTHLTDRAWTLAQAYDVRLLTDMELHDHDDLPPLPKYRPPNNRQPHRYSRAPYRFRDRPTPVLIRRGNDTEAPVFGGPPTGPCYVTDRTGHNDYGADDKE
jgi:hypothetical protein